MSEKNPEQAPLTGGSAHPGMMGSKGYAHMAAPYIFPWTFMWFGAALCVMVGAGISLVSEIISLEWIDALEMLYLFCFGVLLATVDTPLFTQMGFVHHIRQVCNRFISLVTRVTGKGVVHMFLGCTLWSSMWSNLEGGGFLFLAFFLGIVIFSTGIISVILGCVKSKKLHDVRSQLAASKDKDLAGYYVQFAVTNHAAGITTPEFDKLAMSLPNPVRFEGSDLTLVFGAISSDPNREFISSEDLDAWVHGGWTFI
jgi:hypothetical protein